MTSYTAWEKYDVDEAMKRLEEEEKKEEKRKEEIKYEKKKDGVVEDACDSAQVLATKAALAALKAKKSLRKKFSKSNLHAENEPFDKVNELEKQADLLTRKSALIQVAMTKRAEGNTLLAKNNTTQAIELFKSIVQAMDELDQVIILLEKTEVALEKNEAAENAIKPCTEHESHGCGCHDKEETPPAPVLKPLPKSHDVKGVATMLRIDALMGLGKCALERCHYAAASEYFRDVLLLDGNHLEAWKLRGSAFLSMGAPLIATLHLNKVVILEGTDAGEGSKLLAEVENDIVNDPKPEDEMYNVALRYLQRQSYREILERIILLRKEADVIMVEGFYLYSNIKYQAILSTLNELKWQNPVLNELRVACHSNIASGLVEMKKQYQKAIHHIQTALELDPDNPSLIFRLGQCYRQTHQFDLATKTLHIALEKLNAVSSSTDASRMMIKEEIERNAFDQSELDPVYIKQQTLP
ncbi:hypothetical protein THRCLA_20595 [Thraustotheca clavata]|uniref:Uncharacterized protein n=1 Tax=Thraustotheca clavata TaxID=74557 RepID=A0A1W0A5P5_9STRA|nr:hypothetical protein THRCLA_20595 [Thraustotheca clavata]